MPGEDRFDRGDGPSWRRGSSPEDVIRRFGEGLKGKGPSPLIIVVILALIWAVTTPC